MSVSVLLDNTQYDGYAAFMGLLAIGFATRSVFYKKENK
jgi:hypothetical protein